MTFEKKNLKLDFKDKKIRVYTKVQDSWKKHKYHYLNYYSAKYANDFIKCTLSVFKAPTQRTFKHFYTLYYTGNYFRPLKVDNMLLWRWEVSKLYKTLNSWVSKGAK